MISGYFTKESLKIGAQIFKAAFFSFINNRALSLSASLAFYTIFSLAPLLLLMISLTGIFFGRDAMQGKVFSEINGMVGNDAARQIQDTIKSLETSGKSTISVIIGIVTLIIGAVSVFGEIQDSVNIIWRVRVRPEKGWGKLIADRLLSLSIVIILGFLLLVSLFVNGALLAINDRLKNFLPDVTILLFTVLNVVISFIVTFVIFGVIFKVIPDVKIRWKDIVPGAVFTAFLFMLGRLLIFIYIEGSGAISTYGAAGSLIVILLWIYYTAAIFYFGAEVTRAYADFKGLKITPAKFAVQVEEKEQHPETEALPGDHK
jgi:membrane protein